jgi:hypothetical protein
MVRDLAPLVGRRLSFGVVPNWHGQWPLAMHSDYCRLLQENANELLLHGYFHQRGHGCGPVSMLTGGSDEMNGLDADATRQTIERGQRDFVKAFGAPARGFLAPGWQAGQVSLRTGTAPELDHVLGFFSLESRRGQRVPLATWAWDCGRWGWLGHVGHAAGRLAQALSHSVPVLAIHPRDIDRGFWPKALQLTEELLERGYEPSSLEALLDAEATS